MFLRSGELNIREKGIESQLQKWEEDWKEKREKTRTWRNQQDNPIEMEKTSPGSSGDGFLSSPIPSSRIFKGRSGIGVTSTRRNSIPQINISIPFNGGYGNIYHCETQF